MQPHVKAMLRSLPKIDAVLARDDVRAIEAPRWAVVEAVRAEVDGLRRAILAAADAPVPTEVTIAAVERRVTRLLTPSLRRVINATGVVLHTNLGRAPLAQSAMARAIAISCGYSNLEYDLDRGRRGSRHGHLVGLLAELTGAEDAVVVNNNAGAVMIGLAALAAGHEVVMSRGELIEIGGSFRIPDVMRLSGAELVEVGCTNKTHASDYRSAVTDRTALLLKVHRSNFAIVGFCAEVDHGALAELGREHEIATMVDLGSGWLLPAADLVAMGLDEEPSVREVVEAGIDVVTFSGDKLLGGPQAGLICGRRDAIARIRKHPLMRALRPDKVTMALLDATLSLYRDGRAREVVPAVAMLAAPVEQLKRRAEQLVAEIGDVGDAVSVRAQPCKSAVGGGAMPLASLASWGVTLAPASGSQASASDIERALREAEVPVIGRIADDALILDVRTVADRELGELALAVRAACHRVR